MGRRGYWIEDKTYEELMKGSFTIPDVQRGYVWTKSACEKLLENICDAALDKNNRPYPLGSVVLLDESEEGGDCDLRPYDGQQRLMTLTLIMKAARDLLIKARPVPPKASAHQKWTAAQQKLSDRYSALISKIANTYLFEEDVCFLEDDEEPKPKLHLRSPQLQSWFSRFLNTSWSELAKGAKPAKGTPAAAIQENYERMYKLLKKKFYKGAREPKATYDEIEAFVIKLGKQVRFCAEYTDDIFLANELYYARNTCGQPMSESEKAKTAIMRVLATKTTAVSKLAKSWDNVRLELPSKKAGDAVMDIFILDLVNSAGGTRCTKKKMVDVIREQMTDVSSANTFIKKMEKAAPHYASIIDPQVRPHRSPLVTARLCELADLKFSQHRPAALAVMMAELPDEVLEELLNGCARLAMGCSITGVLPSRATKVLNRITQKVSAGSIKTTTQMREALAEELRKLIDKDALVGAVKSLSYERQRDWCKNVLSVMEEKARNEKGLAQGHDLLWANMSIDHVLAKKESISAGGDIDDAVINCVGNLVLLDGLENSALGAADYEERCQAYADSESIVTRSIHGGHEGWGIDEIKARSDEMAEEFAKWILAR